MQKITIDFQNAGIRLDKLLKKQHIPIGLINKWVRNKNLKINNQKAKIDQILLEGDEIIMPMQNDNHGENSKNHSDNSPQKSKYKALSTPPEVIYEDKHILVINKPYGIASQGGTGISKAIDQHYKALLGEQAPKLVHRLDKETTGVLIMAKTQMAAQKLAANFKSREVEKIYLALAVGKPSQKQGEIKSFMGKREDADGYERVFSRNLQHTEKAGDLKFAVTEYKLLDSLKDIISLIELKPLTGRMHQLRIHLNDLSCPIAFDYKYGGKLAEVTVIDIPDKLYLHAVRLTFKHPINGQQMSLKAPLPDHFKKACKECGFEMGGF